MTMHIRNADSDDASLIASFNSAMAEETEGRGLDASLINPGVAALLADSGKGRYWVAESDGRVVGQIMVTYEWSDWRNGTIWWIQSVYIHPDYRRQGVFSGLYRHVEGWHRATVSAAESDSTSSATITAQCKPMRRWAW